MAQTKALGAFLAVWLTAGAASAAPLDITNISGVWQNPVGGLAVAGTGTSTITWGDGLAPDSGYSFAAAADILGATTGVPILLGVFTHFNEVIPVPNLTGVDLAFGFDTNGAPVLVAAVFPFAHNETPNLTGTSPADDDIVTITTPLVNIPITVGLDTYFFNLLGFSIDGGITVRQRVPVARGRVEHGGSLRAVDHRTGGRAGAAGALRHQPGGHCAPASPRPPLDISHGHCRDD